MIIFGIPAYAATKVTVSGFYSRKQMKTPVYVSIVCIVMDAPGSVTSALSGKLGMLDGVSTKTVTTKANEA